jgi:hypothetical protein
MQKDHIALHEISNNKKKYGEKTKNTLVAWFNFFGFADEIIILLCSNT